MTAIGHYCQVSELHTHDDVYNTNAFFALVVKPTSGAPKARPLIRDLMKNIEEYDNTLSVKSSILYGDPCFLFIKKLHVEGIKNIIS